MLTNFTHRCVRALLPVCVRVSGRPTIACMCARVRTHYVCAANCDSALGTCVYVYNVDSFRYISFRLICSRALPLFCVHTFFLSAVLFGELIENPARVPTWKRNVISNQMRGISSVAVQIHRRLSPYSVSAVCLPVCVRMCCGVVHAVHVCEYV